MGFNYYVEKRSKEEVENAEEAATIILNNMVSGILCDKVTFEKRPEQGGRRELAVTRAEVTRAGGNPGQGSEACLWHVKAAINGVEK